MGICDLLPGLAEYEARRIIQGASGQTSEEILVKSLPEFKPLELKPSGD
jgi:hypothetical protein